MKNTTKTLFIAAALLVLSCAKDDTPEVLPMLSVSTGSTINFKCDNPLPKELRFVTNCAWSIEVPSSADWLSVNPASGDAGGEAQTFKVSVTAQPSPDGKSRTSQLNINYAGQRKVVKVVQSSLHQCSDPTIPEDMIFSTTLGKNNTNVAQGFDYDPDEDVVYITQKYGTYRNHIGWQKRETKSSTTLAANYMTLACFSHGNNIAIEKNSNGRKYVWAPNYATRQDDGSYDQPHIVSRFPLQSGQTLYNTDTSENYYFGLVNTWPAFDFANDLIAVCDYHYFYIYKLSELEALPTKEIKLDFTITYGGVVGSIDAKIPEWTGQPVVKAKDCRSVAPLYKVTFDYTKRGLHWQSFCIDDGWIYAILQADKKSAPDIIFDTYVEAYKMDGSQNIYKVRQEYMQNRDRIVGLGWTDTDYFYCEPEGIKVMDDTMLLLYSIRGNDSHPIRRPVIFKLASPVKK